MSRRGPKYAMQTEAAQRVCVRLAVLSSRWKRARGVALLPPPVGRLSLPRLHVAGAHFVPFAEIGGDALDISRRPEADVRT